MGPGNGQGLEAPVDSDGQDTGTRPGESGGDDDSSGEPVDTENDTDEGVQP